MPVSDIWGLLKSVKNAAAFIWSSKMALMIAVAAFTIGAVSTWLAWWSGWILPTVSVDGNWAYTGELEGGELGQIFCYCVHADYAIKFVNFAINFVNTFFPFITGLVFSLLVFRFTLFLKHAVGSDIKEST